MRLSRGLRPGLVLAAVIVVLDQLSKWYVVEVVMNPPRTIPVTPFFNLVMGWNRGVSFGLFNTDSAVTAWLLPALAAAIVAVLAVWLSRVDRLPLALALGSIIGGAVGNLIDRLRFGAVADFLDVHAFGYHWPAFNLADTMITVGAAVLILDSLFVRAEPGTRGKGNERKKRR